VFVKAGTGWASATHTAKLTAADGAASDFLGRSVAVSGNTVVAGAPEAKIGSNSFQGAGYVFVKPGPGWVNVTQTAKLTASDGAADDRLGSSVAVSGDTVVAGALRANGFNPDQGAAYVFVKPGTGWANGTQTAKLTASDGAANDELGHAIALSGDTIVGGAPFADVGGRVDRGAAYVFVKPGTGWANGTQTEKLTAADGVAEDLLGHTVAVSAATAVAGAPYADVGGNADAGAAYVFQSNPPTAVRLLAFTARRTKAGAILRWRLADQLDAAGFNVYRERSGRRVRLNRRLIASAGGSTNAYSFLDRTARPDVRYRYRLELVGVDGRRRWIGSVRTEGSSASRAGER
jgi:hypothetical protein